MMHATSCSTPVIRPMITSRANVGSGDGDGDTCDVADGGDGCDVADGGDGCDVADGGDAGSADADSSGPCFCCSSSCCCWTSTLYSRLFCENRA